MGRDSREQQLCLAVTVMAAIQCQKIMKNTSPQKKQPKQQQKNKQTNKHLPQKTKTKPQQQTNEKTTTLKTNQKRGVSVSSHPIGNTDVGRLSRHTFKLTKTWVTRG